MHTNGQRLQNEVKLFCNQCYTILIDFFLSRTQVNLDVFAKLHPGVTAIITFFFHANFSTFQNNESLILIH